MVQTLIDPTDGMFHRFGVLDVFIMILKHNFASINQSRSELRDKRNGTAALRLNDQTD